MLSLIKNESEFGTKKIKRAAEWLSSFSRFSRIVSRISTEDFASFQVLSFHLLV